MKGRESTPLGPTPAKPLTRFGDRLPLGLIDWFSANGLASLGARLDSAPFRGLYSPTKQPWNMGLEIYVDIIVDRCTELLRDIEQLVDGKEIGGTKNQHCFSYVFPSLATQMLMPSFRIRISSFRFPTSEFRGLHKPSFSVMYNVAIISCTL